MKFKVLIMVAACVFGSSEINAMLKKSMPVFSKPIVNMAGIADLVSSYGYKVHKCSHAKFQAYKKNPQMASVEKISIHIDVLPSMNYIIRTKHEVSNRIFNCGYQVENVLDVHQRTAVVDGFERVVTTIQDYLNGR